MNMVPAVSVLLVVLAMSVSIGQAGHHEYSEQMRNAISSLKKLAPPESRARSGDGDQCALGCARKEWQQGVKQIPGANLDPYPGLMNGEQVGKVCAVYDKTETCLGKCPAGPGKTGVEMGLGLPKYMCKDSTLKQHAQCIYEAVQGVKSECAADNKCGKYKKVVEGPTPTTAETLKEFMKNACQYMTCQSDCVKPAVDQKCTAAAVTAIQGIPVKGAEMIKALCQVNGMPQLYPQECRAIAP